MMPMMPWHHRQRSLLSAWTTQNSWHVRRRSRCRRRWP